MVVAMDILLIAYILAAMNTQVSSSQCVLCQDDESLLHLFKDCSLLSCGYEKVECGKLLG